MKKLIEQINPFHIQIVAGSFSEKFSYRSYVSVGNSAGYVRFTGLPENCMTGHMSFSGKFSWLCQISWTTRKLYDRCSAGYVRFPGLPENCMTGHMSFSEKFSWLDQISWTTRKLYDRSYVFQREFRWLYQISLCVINS